VRTRRRTTPCRTATVGRAPQRAPRLLAKRQFVQVGWAPDGYPVEALCGHEDGVDTTSAVRAMRASYYLRRGTRPDGSPGDAYDGTFGADWEYVAGLGDLDACNGRAGTLVIDGAERTTCAYFLTDTFPFLPRCTKAAPDASRARLRGRGKSAPASGARTGRPLLSVDALPDNPADLACVLANAFDVL